MSHLLTRLIKAGKSEKSILRISFGLRECEAILSSAEDIRIIWEKKWQVSSDNDYDWTNEFDLQWLDDIARDINQLVAASTPEIHIILPDHLFKHMSLRLEEIPNRKNELERLIKWRLTEECYIDTDKYAIDYKQMSGENENFSVFCFEKDLLNKINAIFQAHNLLIMDYIPATIHQLLRQNMLNENAGFVVATENYVTYGIAQGGLTMRLYQNEALDNENEELINDVFKKVRREFVSVMMSDPSFGHNSIFLLQNSDSEIPADAFEGFNILTNEDFANRGAIS